MSIDDVYDTAFDPSSVDTFTDRQSEVATFHRTVLDHLHRLSQDPEQSGSSPRDNVLVYYGIGGLGKSSLSHRLEDWITNVLPTEGEWGPPPPISRPLLTTRIDLAERQGLDVERSILELRATVRALGVRTTSFDVAFALWWRQYHGDLPIPRLPVRAQSTGSPVGMQDVRDQLADTAKSILKGIGASFGLAELGMRLVKTGYATVKRKVEHSRARENPFLQGVLTRIEHGADLDTLSMLLVLLTWDLRDLPVEERPLWIVYVDTYEIANDNDSRRGEREFQRLVIGLQDALWVVTGRTRLDWSESERTGSIDRVGKRLWPGLAVGESSRQHPIGHMSESDARRFIDRSMTGVTDSVVFDSIAGTIIERCGGWPLYLDHAVQLWREFADLGVEASPDSFNVSFDALVQRVIRDLPQDERLALRIACVFPRCSVDLVVRASDGKVSEGSVLRLLNPRGLLTLQTWPLFPYKVHDSLRSLIRSLTPAQGGWTINDWSITASAGMNALADVYAEHQGVDERIDCFSLAMSVALDFRLDADWLVAAAGSLPSMRLAAQAVPPVPPESENCWAGHMAAFLQCWGDAQGGRSRATRLANLVESRTLPPTIYSSAQRFRAYNLRNHGDDEGAVEIFTDLIDQGAANALANHRQRCIGLMRLGRFVDAHRDFEEALNLGMDPEAAGYLVGLSAGWHGLLSESAEHLQQRYQSNRLGGQERLARENHVGALERRALLGTASPSEARAIRDESLFALDGIYRTGCFAVALATAGTPDFAEAYAELESGFELPPEPGDLTDDRRWQMNVARGFDAAVRDDAGSLRHQLDSMSGGHMWCHVMRSWLVMFDGHFDIPDGPQWLEPEYTVVERWQQVVLRRRLQVAT